MCSKSHRRVSPSKLRSQVLFLAAACVLSASVAVQAELPEGLGAYYRFDDGAGLTVVDETGAHNGTITGALDWVAGVDGTALQFRGGNGSPFVNTGAWQTTGSEGFAFALWVKWAGTNSLYQGLVGQRDGTMYWWSEMSPDGGQLRFKSNTSPQSNLYLTPPHMVQNEWTHIAFSHDAAAKQGVVYVNGEEKLAGTWTLPTGNFATYRAGIGVVNCADGLGTFNGAIDEVMIFQRPLTAAEIKGAMNGFANPVAGEPNPANGQSDVLVDTPLTWASNGLAASHDVYLGTSSDDLAAASTGQAETTYQPAALLEYGTTYFWRIDEVNAAPDNTVFTGDIWHFTTEPFSYPIDGVVATASSAASGMGPEKTVDGSGLTGDLHSKLGAAMWLSSPTGSQPTWIQFEFGKVYKLDQMWVWNSNQEVETFVGFGCKDVTVEYSTDGSTWTTLAGVPEFAQGTGMDNSPHDTTVDFGGVQAKYVKLTINSNYGTLMQYGLSEVRFFYVPVQARQPEPAVAATDVSVEPELNWRPGREAISHEVFLSDSLDAVTAGTAPSTPLDSHSYTPGDLDFGTTYYWKVDEVGEAGTVAGEVWNFTTQEFATIEDFEPYNDTDNRIYDTWADGYFDHSSGSTVGYIDSVSGTFGERTIVHGGTQSMPLTYDNRLAPYYSETVRTFDSPQNWTTNGADTLRLWVQGYPPAYVDDAGTIHMSAAGHDIWDTADDFRFAYKTLSGNGSIIVKVESLVNTNAWAKAGVMIRQSLDADSTFVYMVESFSSGVSMGSRAVATGGCTSVTQTGIVAPQWVKLTRTGDVFTTQYSADGTTWTDLKNSDGTNASMTVAMVNPVYIGLCVTSHNTAAATTAMMSGAAVTGTVSGAWQVAAIGDDPQTANDPAALYVTIQDNAGKTATAINSTAITTTGWTQWQIPLSSLTGVNFKTVKKMYIGAGGKTSPVAGGQGTFYIDDISFGKPVSGQ